MATVAAAVERFRNGVTALSFASAFTVWPKRIALRGWRVSSACSFSAVPLLKSNEQTACHVFDVLCFLRQVLPTNCPTFCRRRTLMSSIQLVAQLTWPMSVGLSFGTITSASTIRLKTPDHAMYVEELKAKRLQT